METLYKTTISNEARSYYYDDIAPKAPVKSWRCRLGMHKVEVNSSLRLVDKLTFVWADCLRCGKRLDEKYKR